MNGITKLDEKFYLPVDHTANNIAEAMKYVPRTWKLPENW